MTFPRVVHYVTSSHYKQEECRILLRECSFSDGTAVSSEVRFEFRNVEIKENLEVEIADMVRTEVLHAYQSIKVPCIVEHAGLIFNGFQNYPGGLTKPMWNTLKDRFVFETNSQGRRVAALAVIAYCDGSKIHTFEGRTEGTLAAGPRGDRAFYWDTVFIPDDPSGVHPGKTYAEIVEDDSLGITYKVKKLSQSTKAMMKFLEYLRSSDALLWPNL